MTNQVKQKKPKSPLQALTENINKPFYASHDVSSDQVQSIPIEQCHPWLHQDRDDAWMTESRCQDLIDSIRKHGQKIPAIVRARGQHYELIAGKRRWFACRTLGLPLLVQVIQASDRDCAILMHLENKDRQDISDFERALSYRRQLDAGLFNSQEDLSLSLSISKSHLSKMLKAATLLQYSFVKNVVADVTRLSLEKSYQLVKTLESDKQIAKKIEKYCNALVEPLSASSLLQQLLNFAESEKSRSMILKDKNNRIMVKAKETSNRLQITVAKQAKNVPKEQLREYVINLLEEYLS